MHVADVRGSKWGRIAVLTVMPLVGNIAKYRSISFIKS
jgi:hypothetical protein